jgi:transcriptional regulator with XRE-family HTH domain
MSEQPVDPAIIKARALFEASGKTLDELGLAMGYEGDVARKSAWQFLNKTSDPRASMLRRFAKAIGVQVDELLAGHNGGSPKANGLRRNPERHK